MVRWWAGLWLVGRAGKGAYGKGVGGRWRDLWLGVVGGGITVMRWRGLKI